MIDFATVHPTNPNDAIGGGACLATGGLPSEDCAGEWVNFWRTQTEDAASPYSVICTKHLAELNEALPDIERKAPGDALPLRQRAIVTKEDTGLASAEPTPYVDLSRV